MRMATLARMALFALLTQAMAAESWQQKIAAGLGKSGAELPGGIYRVGLPRTDLKVTVDGVAIKPAFALGSWLAFRETGHGDAVMVMGDLVLTADEVNRIHPARATGAFDLIS